jgi:ribulose-phosphate 3-epimerase
MIDVIPGIGPQAEWKVIEERLNLMLPHTQWVQIDFADNTFVPNTTFMDFAAFKPYAQKLSLEAHLMVASPEKYIKPAADAGFRRLIAHVEAHDPRLFFEQVKFEDVEVGIAIDGPTEFEQVEPYLEEVDFVLLMTVESGFSGQPFLPECVEKIKTIHTYLPDLPIEVDGGITDVTASLVIEAGATRLVSTHYIFSDPANIARSIENLRGMVK